MMIGEVGLMTGDVKRLADFYKWLLDVDDQSDDVMHQVILAQGTTLAVCYDEQAGRNGHGGICLAFTVPDVDKQHARLLEKGVTVLEPPTTRPWGARNMSFLDPDGNAVYFRQFIS